MDNKGNIHTNSKNIADLLKEQYSSVFSKPRESYQYENIDYDCDTMNEVYFIKENILKQINKLNNKGSPGPDGVVARCYKYGEEFILDTLIDIYNHMRDECYSPQKSREAWISPVWKGVDKMKAENYRPIALTNIFSKIFEGVIRENILEHLSKNNVIDEEQHGSLKGRSTTSQLLKQIEMIFDYTIDGSGCDIIYLDFSKAYDRVDHFILISKPQAIGICGNTLKLI